MAETTEVKPVKPGVKSSELYVTLVTVLTGLAMTLGWLTPEKAAEVKPWVELVVQLGGAFLAAISAGAYAISRGIAKK